MSVYTHSQHVRLHIGNRPEYHIGVIHCDNSGRIDPEELAKFLVAVGEYIEHLVDVERKEMESDREL